MKPQTPSLSNPVIHTIQLIKLSTHTSQVIPFFDPFFLKYTNYFQGFVLADDFSLDLHTLQHQQTQDPVLKNVYYWIRHNTKPNSLTSLTHGTHFLHAYYKDFAQLFIDDGTNLISLYTKHKFSSDTQPNT